MRAVAAVYDHRMKASLFVAILFFAVAALAQQYRWVD